MLQIWLLYDFYFLVCAYIVAKPYVGFLLLSRYNVCATFHQIKCSSSYRPKLLC